MKKVVAILIASLALCVGAYYWSFNFSASMPFDSTKGPMELAWLKTDLKLSDDDFAAICSLHESYMPHCMEMCGRIKRQHQQVQSLIASTNMVTREIEQSLEELSDLRAECQVMMLQHFFEVSRRMPPEQAKRYLAQMQKQTTLLYPEIKHH